MKTFLALTLTLAVLVAGCATLSNVAATITSQAITDSEALHCGTVGAPLAPLCLTDSQFQQVNGDLLKVSQAGLLYTQLLAQANAAKSAPPAQAVVDFVAVISQALNDISTISGVSVDTILNDLKNVLKGL